MRRFRLLLLIKIQTINIQL